MKGSVINNRKKLTTLTDDQIEQILDGTLDVGIRVGFELEFQKLNGKEMDEFTEGCDCLSKPDPDKLKLAALNIIENTYCKYLIEHFSTKPAPTTKAEKLLRATLPIVGVEGTREALLKLLSVHPKRSWPTFSTILDKADEAVCAEVMATLDPSDHLCTKCICNAPRGFAVMRKHLNVAPDLVVKEDGSVRGGEITTHGPQTVSDCLAITSDILSDNDLTIDRKCSYHIHFSVEDMTHSYSNAIQSEGMRFFIEQGEREGHPDFIKERFEDFRFFLPELTMDKYAFINYNSKYRTWEFRVFGNVKTVEDAKWCYRTLLKSMRHVYKVLNGETMSLRSILSEVSSTPTQKVKVGEFYDNYGKDLVKGRVTLADTLEKIRLTSSTEIDNDTSGVA
jgi:hypothetical protein